MSGTVAAKVAWTVHKAALLASPRATANHNKHTKFYNWLNSVNRRLFIYYKITSLLRDGGSLSSIARWVGVTQPAISYARDGVSCGAELQLRFADAYWGGSFDAMADEALDGISRCVEPSTVVANGESSYPARDRAAVAARALGTISEDAIARVRAFTYTNTANALRITADEWLGKMREAERDIRRIDNDTNASTPPGKVVQLLDWIRAKAQLAVRQTNVSNKEEKETT